MNETDKFTGLAGYYNASRPAYSNELIDALYKNYGFCANSTIADIGSGTGKFASQLLERGSMVYCVEPNADMMNTAIVRLKCYDRFIPVSGGADNTGLSDNCVDYITAAQSFHWFNPDTFKKECKRILKKDGLVCLIWNVHDMSCDINLESCSLYQKYCPDFKGFSNGIHDDTSPIKGFFNRKYEYIQYENPILYDRDKFLSRSLSASYTLKPNDPKYDEYCQALNDLFNKYEKDGIVTIKNYSCAYIGRI